MKLIDGDELAERVMYKFINDPDYTLEDAVYDIQDAEEIEVEELVPHAEAFKTGAEWALDQVEKDIADRIRRRLE